MNRPMTWADLLVSVIIIAFIWCFFCTLNWVTDYKSECERQGGIVIQSNGGYYACVEKGYREFKIKV